MEQAIPAISFTIHHLYTLIIIFSTTLYNINLYLNNHILSINGPEGESEQAETPKNFILKFKAHDFIA